MNFHVFHVYNVFMTSITATLVLSQIGSVKTISQTFKIILSEHSFASHEVSKYPHNHNITETVPHPYTQKKRFVVTYLVDRYVTLFKWLITTYGNVKNQIK